MKRPIRITLIIILSLLGCIFLQKFCRSKTDGFALYKIESHLPFNPDFETKAVSSQELAHVCTVLDQPFYYMGKGAQCFVFVSQDGQHVLKFFKLYHLRAPEWFSKMPLPSFLQSYRERKVARKFEELARDFISYKLAYDLLQEDTGLLYVHLNKTDTLHKKVTFYDKIGIKYSVDIDSMEFLLQKKADLFYPGLKKMIESGNTAAVKESIKNLIQFLAKRSSFGLYDKDPDINTNFGLCGSTPIQIDVGRFRPDPSRKDPILYINDIKRVTDNLQQWLEAQDKELSDYLLQEIAGLEEPIKLAA